MQSISSVDRMLAVYKFEVTTRGKRGALRRAGEMLGVSDETVRRAVARESAQTAPADSLRYEPPPLAYPEPEPLPQAFSVAENLPQESPQLATDATIDDAPAVEPEVTPHEADATCHTNERESVAVSFHFRSPQLTTWSRPIDDRGITARAALIEWGKAHLPAVQLMLGVGVVALIVLIGGL